MNSKDYRNIREAYLQVYEPQELTEEQVWEGVEEWVNALLQEGYDLSDYTWEEMYESYLEEQGRSGSAAIRNQNVYTPPAQEKPQIAGGGMGGRRGSGGNPDAARTITTTQKPQFGTTTPRGSSVTSTGVSGLSAADRAAYSGGGGNAAAQRGMGQTTAQVIAQGKKNIGRFDGGPKQGNPNIKGSPVVGPKPTSPTPSSGSSSGSGGSSSGSGGSGGSTPRPTSTAPKPTTPTPTTTPTKPAIGTTPGGTKFERRTPTSAELSAAQDARAAGKGEEGAIKAGVEASKPATPAPNPVKANVPGFALGGKPPTPSAEPSGETDRLKKALDIKKSDVTSSFDYFDAVKGYLIDEGYADTEEAAVAIMGNMSNAWVRSIIG